MQLPKKYLHDRLILLLLTCNTFLVLLNAVLILLRLDSGSGSYIVQYRANLGLSGYVAGDSTTLYSFVLFGFIVLVFQVLLSIRAYQFKRQFALTILYLSALLLVLSIIVSNALLALR